MIFQEFYQSLYPVLFYQWISLNQSTYKNQGIIFEKSFSNDSVRILIFQTNTVIGKIVIWENGIVEEEIQRCNGEKIFYLHYELIDLSQACQLFDEFYQTLIQYNLQKIYKIALCCTGGLSTAIFAQEIEEVCQMSHLPFSISSLSLEELETKNEYFDSFYLAPQIAYMQPSLLKTLKKPVHHIDATDYATKNFHAIIKKIKEDLKNSK